MHTHAISTYNLNYACIAQGVLWYAAPSSGTWHLQYGVVYVPVRVKRRCVVRKLGIANGATATGNLDLGLYDAAGIRLVSTGPTAQSGVNAEQVTDVTDTTIGPGLYYLACVMDGTTATVYRQIPTAPLCAAHGVLTETLGSGTLPATATWTLSQTHTLYPVLFAFLGTTVA
jgi:hypothetical protein